MWFDVGSEGNQPVALEECCPKYPGEVRFELHWVFWGFHGSVLWQDTSELQPSTVKPQEIHEYVKYRRNMLKAAVIKYNFINQS